MNATVAIIDYGSGNLASAAKALERAAGDAATGQRVLVTSRAEDVAASDRIVLPGVGAFADCMQGLAALPGMLEALKQTVVTHARPFLGICVGMQLMATRGLEHGEHKGFDWIPGDVVRLNPDRALKVPHMGWNTLRVRRPHPLLAGLGPDDHAYFLHSFHLRASSPDTLLADTDYGGDVTAVVGRDNLVGVQFHPEKSQRVGLHLLANFLKWSP
ncbi:MAG: imidazole glycerol phosphate synthase subunit HisH [Alphaproteobacteria bacterium]|nr:imidazole glycerol phosphate synthase subunit HisH [Alphaproteobacteria bacterium]